MPATIFLLAIGWFNGKFAVQASFLLAVYAVKQFEFGKDKLLRYMPFTGAIIVTLFLATMAPGLPPDSQELEAAQLAVILAEGTTICNQWGVGHIVTYYGGVPSDYGGGQQQCARCKDCIIDWIRNCRELVPLFCAHKPIVVA